MASPYGLPVGFTKTNRFPRAGEPSVSTSVNSRPTSPRANSAGLLIVAEEATKLGRLP